MKKLILALVASLFAHVAFAETYVVRDKWDIDGAAAAGDEIVAAAAAADSTTYTLVTTTPDTPRVLEIALTDAGSNIAAGTATLLGTNSAGETISTVYTFSGAGSGTVTSTDEYATVTSFITSALTGETGAETLAVNYTSTLPYTYCSYGPTGALTGSNAWKTSSRTVTTTAASTTITSVTATDYALLPVDIDDLVLFNTAGTLELRVVETNADDDTITVDTAMSTTSPTAGVMYRYQKSHCGTEASEGWYPTGASELAYFLVDVDTMAGTGGIDMIIECRDQGAITAPEVAFTHNYAAAVTTSDRYEIEDPPDQCRIGFKWGTNDDADAADDVVNVTFHRR